MFEGIFKLGVSYFHSLYYESNKINIVEIMKISSYFQRLVTFTLFIIMIQIKLI
jgi:hypothetical protein